MVLKLKPLMFETLDGLNHPHENIGRTSCWCTKWFKATPANGSASQEAPPRVSCVANRFEHFLGQVLEE